MSLRIPTIVFGVFLALSAAAQTVFVDTLFAPSDSLLDIYQYQIPAGYDPQNAAPLLVGWHQWGGNQAEFFYTPFASEANTRGWIALAAWGGHSRNWTNQDTQEWMQRIIEELSEACNIDQRRIYMVGGSMGGASGMICANNHLDPTRPMVAATGSASGILDDVRRYYEQGNNNSMREVFGGKPGDVPFTYHRNSAIFFADSLNSMHCNLLHTPVYLTYGANENEHQQHALDLYDVLTRFSTDVYIGTTSNGHGWGVFDVPHVCDWLAQYTLVSDPDTLVISTDEDSRSYWTSVQLSEPEQFAHYAAGRAAWGAEGIEYRLGGLRNVEWLLLEELDNGNDPQQETRVVIGEAESPFKLGFHRSYQAIDDHPILFLNGTPAWGPAPWPSNDTLALLVAAMDQVELYFYQESVVDTPEPETDGERLRVITLPTGVRLEWGVGSAQVRVFDLLGRQVGATLSGTASCLLETGALASGVYFVQVDDGREVLAGRFQVWH